MSDYHLHSSATNHWCNLVKVQSSPYAFPHIPMEPVIYKEAIQDSKWVDAIQKELEALKLNHTWDFVP